MKHKDFLDDYLKLKHEAIKELKSLLNRFPGKSVDLSEAALFLNLCPGGACGYDSWQVMCVTYEFILIENEYGGEYEAEYDDLSVLDLDFIMDNMPEPE